MTLEWWVVALLLFSALLHASWNAITKSSGDPLLTLWVVTITGSIGAGFGVFFVDFPHRDEASRHNVFGLMLTAVLRPAIDGPIPFHLFMASLERTGKGIRSRGGCPPASSRDWRPRLPTKFRPGSSGSAWR